MSSKLSIEEEMKKLQKQFGGVVQLVKNLKISVEALDKKIDEKETKETKEIKEILDAQTIIDEILVANSDAIKRIDKEIESMVQNKAKADETRAKCSEEKHKKSELKTNFEAKGNAEKANGDGDNSSVGKTKKKCKFFNRGFCKYSNKCRFGHPLDVCKDYLRDYKCERKECCDRHPKRCKWDINGDCRRGSECLYLHIDKPDGEQNMVSNEYQCQGCRYIWNDRDCMKEHTIKNMRVFFCLNCDDWIKYKTAVFDQGWTMFDNAGFLRTDI